MLRRVAPTECQVQPPVAQGLPPYATVCSMQEWEKWWELAKLAKQDGKRDADIAEHVSDRSGRHATRQQVNHWFNLVREPTISQFIHLCDFLGLDPGGAPWGSFPPRPKKAKALRGRATTKSNGEAKYQ